MQLFFPDDQTFARIMFLEMAQALDDSDECTEVFQLKTEGNGTVVNHDWMLDDSDSKFYVVKFGGTHWIASQCEGPFCLIAWVLLEETS